MKEEDVGKIFDLLDNSKPIVKLVRGINNKEIYFEADALWDILFKKVKITGRVEVMNDEKANNKE